MAVQKDLHSYPMRNQVRSKVRNSKSLFAAFVHRLCSGSTVHIPTATEGKNIIAHLTSNYSPFLPQYRRVK